jgi:hypothetical protein
MCVDPENNALFNSGPLNKPVFYVYGTILLFYVIIVYKSILNHCMKLTVIILMHCSLGQHTLLFSLIISNQIICYNL